jgi:tetratricopeptide (TPR) repeat protein
MMKKSSFQDKNRGLSGLSWVAKTTLGVFVALGVVLLLAHPSSSTWLLESLMISESGDGSSCSGGRGDGSLLGIYGPLVDEVEVFKVTSLSTEARILFRQGLLQMWNFNTPEALRNFEASINFDKEGCPICYWGIAAARGSNINRFVDMEDVQASIKALEVAQNILLTQARGVKVPDGAQVSRFEEILVETQAVRWPTGGTGNETEEWKAKGQDHYDHKYYNKLSSIVTKLEIETDWSPWQRVFIKTLYAESIMTANRWDYFQTDRGTRQPDGASPSPLKKYLRKEIEPAYEALKRVLSEAPTHPLALHLWIHLTEQSSEPGTGEREADLLASYLLKTKSKVGHLVHMPAHTYLRMGLYEKAIESSIQSIKIDQAYDEQCLKSYCPHHNIAVMIHSAMHSARKDLAVQWAPTHGAKLTNHAAAQYISGLFLTPLEFVHAKFGDWSALQQLGAGLESITTGAKAVLDRELNEGSPEVPAYLRTIAAYGESLVATHAPVGADTDPAKKLSQLEAVAGQIVSDEEAFYIPRNHVFYPFHKEAGALMVAIATAALEVRRGDHQRAVTSLRGAVALQDGFQYMEPEHFYTPLRQCLGAALLLLADDDPDSDGEASLREAMEVYATDLTEHPNNVWAYTGLRETYRRLQKLGHHHAQEATEVDESLRAASAHATFTISGSCCELGLC